MAKQTRAVVRSAGENWDAEVLVAATKEIAQATGSGKVLLFQGDEGQGDEAEWLVLSNERLSDAETREAIREERKRWEQT